MSSLNRRSFVSRLAMAAVAGALAPGCASTNPSGRRRHLLCFTKSSGWQHTTVQRGPAGEPALVERVVSRLGTENGFEVTCTKDGGHFDPDRIGEYDAFFFYTSGDLRQPGTDGHPPMTQAGYEALLDTVRNGKGFVGVHSASDTFHSEPDPSNRQNWARLDETVVSPFIELLGGEFRSHGAEQTAVMRIIDSSFPGMDAFGAGAVERFGEWYSLVNINPEMHVLAVLETEGMEGADYQRGPFPVIWARRHGGGRVYYTALGHLPEEWEDQAFLTSLVGGIRWAFGDRQAHMTTNLAEVAPRYAELPPAS